MFVGSSLYLLFPDLRQSSLPICPHQSSASEAEATALQRFITQLHSYIRSAVADPLLYIFISPSSSASLIELWPTHQSQYSFNSLLIDQGPAPHPRPGDVRLLCSSKAPIELDWTFLFKVCPPPLIVCSRGSGTVGTSLSPLDYQSPAQDLIHNRNSKWKNESSVIASLDICEVWWEIRLGS